MPISMADFILGNPWDVHVLRGQSTPPLSKFLWVFPNIGSSCSFHEYVHERHQTDVSIEFRPVFECADTPAGFTGFGIHVDRREGTVTVDPGPPPLHQPSNFIVEATVTRNGVVPNPGEFEIAILRIHVHDALEKIWVTPRQLSVRRPVATGAARTRYAFTVRAEFDDGTVGDITASGQLQFLPDSHFYADPRDQVDRIHLPPQAVVGDTIPITVMTSPSWGALTDSVEMKILEPWATEPTVPKAEWIDGDVRVMNGSLTPEHVPNVVFLACGFTGDDTQQSHLDDLIKFTHSEITTERMLEPYGFLKTSMAYWQVRVPAAHEGVSVRCEVWTFSRGSHLFAEFVPTPLPPPSSGAWRLQHLLYFAGLPMPDDMNRTPAELNTRWDAIMKPIPERVVSLEVLNAWQALGTRTFIDEVDNFPAISLGLPPGADINETGDLAFHDLRGDDHELEAFLGRVEAMPIGAMPPIVLGGAAAGKAIGTLWATDAHPDFPYNNSRFVIAFANVPYGRANAGQRIQTRLSLAPPTEDDEYPGIPVKPVAGRRALILDLPQATKATISIQTGSVAAHELTHTFDLGDEYTEDADTYSGSEDGLDDDPNLTSVAAVLNADGSVRLANIKWNWHRARKAVVTTGKIVPLGPKRFQVPVGFGEGFRLSVDDRVLLRKRENRKVIKRASETETSGEFKIESLGADGNKIVIVTTAAGVNLDKFTAGSVLYVPFPAPATVVPARPYLTLVSPVAERIMRDVIQGPMNGVTCNVASAVYRGTEVPIKLAPNMNLTGLQQAYMVGVYHGGGRYACGILRPAGQCMMRDSYDLLSSRFCQVCQFVLVDRIDPVQHRHIDYQYQKIYTF